MKTVWLCLLLLASFTPKAQHLPFSLSDTSTFAHKLDGLRQRYQIPSLSVGLVYQGKLAWYKGLGYADMERKVAPTRHTVYHLASITKTFGAIILMQLVEANQLNLDDPVTKYGIQLGARWGNDDRITLKHLLTHTAQGNTLNGFKPGYSFGYNGDFYSQLGKAIQKEAGQTFGQLVVDKIIRPLRLEHTAPNIADTTDFALTGYNRMAYSQLVAKPYDKHHNQLVSIAYPSQFNPAAGLMACVSDLATYSVALDEHRLVRAATWEQMVTPYQSVRGKPLPYGLGWFVQTYRGIKVIWHTGWWTGNSSLLVKVPQRDLTFIILANSQDLSRPFYAKYDFFRTNPRLQKDVRASAFARAFLDQFVGKL